MLVVDVLTQMVKWLLEKRLADRSETKAAASAIRIAAFETELLFSLVKIGKPLDDERREKVASSWVLAAIEFRTVDRAVSDQCFEVATMLARATMLNEQTLDEIRAVLESLLKDGMSYYQGPPADGF